MARILDVVAGVTLYELTDKTVFYVAKGTVDNDGSGGNPEGDPDHQDDTSYHFRGKALNAQTVPYVVVPQQLIERTEGVVLGCVAIATNLQNGKNARGIAGDCSGTEHLGEMSVAMAKLLGIDPDPVYGGTQDKIIAYEVLPGVGGEVNGQLAELQPWEGA